jgi:hypothetical protein
MRRLIVFAPAVLLVLILIGGSVAADEVVHFKSGGTLPIVSHKIEGGMIHVDLGDNAQMAFPMSVVERVVEAPRGTMFGRGTAGATNVMSASPNGAGGFAEQQQDALPALQADGSVTGETEEKGYDPALDVVNGVAVYRPVAGSGNPAKADTAVTGHSRVRESRGGPGSLNGAHQVGTHQVIGAPKRRGAGSSSAPVITGISGRDGQVLPTNPPTPPPTPGSETQNGEAGGSSPD